MNKRSDGRWQQAVTIEVNGTKIVKYFYGKSKAEVLRKMAEYEEQTEVKQGKHITFSALAELWWEKHKAAPNTDRGYKSAMSRAVARFGGTAVADIRPVDVNDFIADYVAEYAPAKKTVSTQLSVMRMIFRYGVGAGYLNINPATELEIPKNLRKKKVSLPSKADIAKVKANWDESQMGMIAYWALYTGMRRGELLALTWDDVDMDSGIITINKAVCYGDGEQYIKSAKTEAGIRKVPILNRLRAVIAAITPGEGLIFPGPSGGIMPDGTYVNRWNAYKKRLGIECGTHQLRHAYTTMLIEADVEPQDAQALLGHAQLSTTMDI